MIEKHFSTPLKAADLLELRIGDLVYLTGTLVTGRDEVYRRVISLGCASPVDLRNLGVFHAGPIVRKLPNPENGWEMVSIGPTTSMRMESCQEEFLEETGARLIVGKGGMGSKTAKACRRLGAVHTVFPGGCAVLAATLVERVAAVYWLDLGMGEAMWVLKVKNFGPLIVSIDTEGNNLFGKNIQLFIEKKEAALKTLCPT
ncbi:MAG: L(+)-tartrate dehydratase subunit beta [Treponema sp.]|jgi:L(+)-tartrate dehydratase beta subunit|nr:L(+)-tartrate dehydratase subunit beta [Treponema sp.]